MKRAHEKIKDYVEPQAFDEVQNYTQDPARALAAYRFTDATSDLMARWLDVLADLPRNRGAGHALAGMRGVGKSHTLAAIGALAALPHLRQAVADSHVATSARRLLSRPYTVVRVERGTRSTLREEINVAFVKEFGGEEAEWNQEPAISLTMAAHRSNGPFVLIIDTAAGREVRVHRDDGPFLSELAAATREVNAFIALALDDDIEGADGANVSLSSSFQIDYLDPEHLYRIADLHLFLKNAQARTALHEVYTQLRQVVPGFNWSEPRFAAIYPVHPLIADIAAAVRLYAPTFAFLPFAAAAGPRAVNRPALSLIVLDEVFDRTEFELRKAEDLKQAFDAYDELVSRTVSGFPISQRLQAKLILKGLFILSLDGRGASARELCAAMLFYDEAHPGASIERTEGMLAALAETAPSSFCRSEEKGEARYCFRIKSSTEFVEALAASAESIAEDDAALHTLLCSIARSRFEDWPLTKMEEGATSEAADFALTWRGTWRWGQISWRAQENMKSPVAASSSLLDSTVYDWELVMLAPSSASANENQDEVLLLPPTGQDQPERPARVIWQPARLTADETESLRRLIALRTDSSMLTTFGETAHAAEIAHTSRAERIWSRIYIDDGKLLTVMGQHAFTDEAQATATLNEALGPTLAPVLEALYPQHPMFTEIAGETDVAHLVGEFFSGANQAETSVQELAQRFVLPLGLANLRGGIYALETDEQTLKQPWVREVLSMIEAAGGVAVPLEAVSARLRRKPYGLLREAQHLILAALVAQRRIELVTSNGDRISRRTLDRALSWEEIAGVARIATVSHSAEELTDWARHLTRDERLASIAAPEAREDVRAALDGWLNEWREEKLLEKFDLLPDEGLTTHAWNLASAVRKSFGSAADAVEATLAATISLEEGLQRVADAFGDSLDQFKRHFELLAQLSCFTSGLAQRERARAYLMTAEPTTVDLLESMRRELQAIADNIHTLFDQESARRFDLLWREFHAHYSEHYACLHDEVVSSAVNSRAIDSLTRSDEWRDFEALSHLSIVNHQYWDEATRLRARARAARCELPVRQILQSRPVCDCSFRLARAAAFVNIPQALEELVQTGLQAHRRTLALWSKPLAHALESLSLNEAPTEIRERARTLSLSLAQGTLPTPFCSSDVQLIETALQQTSLPPLRVPLPVEGHALLTREELGERVRQWLDELPNYPAFVEIVGQGEGHGG